MPSLAQQSLWRRLRRATRHGDRVFWIVAAAFAAIVAGLLAAIVAVTWTGSADARHAFGFGFLTSTDWNPVKEQYGALPAIYGTVVSSAIAVLLAAPVGIFIGIFLEESSPGFLRAPLSFLVELLAAIPSVVYGMWGVFVLIPFYRQWIAQPVSEHLGDAIPLLSGPVTVGRGMFVAGLILAIMILPTIAAISRDVLSAVPVHQREAMLALGATRWEMIRHALLPAARVGIIGAIMLGLGRALGETMAATMVIGNTPRINESIFQPATTSASLVASQLPNANSDLHASALILVALVLFGITLLANSAARFLVWKVSRNDG